MLRLLNVFSLIAALSFASALHAQETTQTDADAEPDAATQTDENETTAESEAETTSEAADLDMGREVNEDPTYIKETHGDWQLKCFRTEGQEDLCQMYQLLTEEAGNPVAEVSIFKLPEGSQAAAGATIVVPLGTLLSEDLRMSVDGGSAKSFSYSFCSVVGCFARIGMTAADLEALKKGASAVLQIVPAQAPDQKVNIKMSLSGFTAALENASTVTN